MCHWAYLGSSGGPAHYSVMEKAHFTSLIHVHPSILSLSPPSLSDFRVLEEQFSISEAILWRRACYFHWKMSSVGTSKGILEIAKFGLYVAIPIVLMYTFANNTKNLRKFMGNVPSLTQSRAFLNELHDKLESIWNV
ncbi:hypothetical protein SAY86_002690 [Trapa natans]|uniref:Uncharacterized protein n=1 Tax=Trapa natans TaxID=22666 RepID=A0AAN7R3M0_TRANT|nr:hypothetical protein SAY86_002690 [Trapa natans]